MNNFILVQSTPFGSMQCDFYSNSDKDIFMTREQIGSALEYSEPRKAVQKIHERYKHRLDNFSVVTKLTTTDGKAYDTTLYTAKGVYEICRWSRQPKADAFFDFVYDVLEGLRRGDYQIIAPPKIDSASTDSDKNRAIESEARLLNAKTRQANLLVSVAEKFKDILPKEQVQLLLANATELISDAPLLPNPTITKTYTAGQVGERAGVSANKIGRLANKHKIKTEEYGIWVLDKSKHSSKQVSSFQYNEAGLKKLIELVQQEQK